MDRQVQWLRRRVVASIATQTAETFAAAAVLTFVIMRWQTNESALASVLAAIVIGQVVALARLAHALRTNPTTYSSMRNYVEQPFRYGVSRLHDEEAAHPTGRELPLFTASATITDADVGPQPVLDVYQGPSEMIAASVDRNSGAVTLVSSLEDGRLLVTGADATPPHERLVLAVSPRADIASVIETHRHAISERADVVELGSSAHQVVLDALEIEYDSYVGIGPWLAPFVDLGTARRSLFRLSTRIQTHELENLPDSLAADRTNHPAPPLDRVTVQGPITARDAVPMPIPIAHEPIAHQPIVAPVDVPGAAITHITVASANVAAARGLPAAIASIRIPSAEAHGKTTTDVVAPSLDADTSAVSAAQVSPGQQPFVPTVSMAS